MKALFVLSIALLTVTASAAKITVVPNAACEIESQEGYVAAGQNEIVYVCQNGVWTYFYTRSAKSALFATFVPGGDCLLEGQRKYVKTSASTDDVYVCEAGAWKYLFTRSTGKQD